MGLSAFDAAVFAEQSNMRTVRLAVVSDVHYVSTPSEVRLMKAESTASAETVSLSF